jgi:tellurium resistance protein TerZ
MSVSLTKGTKLDLTKAAADAGASKPLTKIVAGAGWDMKEGKSVDLDLLTIKLGADGKAIADANGNGTNADEAVSFYGNLKTKGTVHSGDNLTGEGDGDDETVTINTSELEPEVKEIVVLVASFSGEKFDEVDNVKLRLVNADGNTELAAYTNTDLGSGNAVEVARIKRDGDTLSVEAVGQNLSEVAGKQGEELIKAIFTKYGVNV